MLAICKKTVVNLSKSENDTYLKSKSSDLVHTKMLSIK